MSAKLGRAAFGQRAAAAHLAEAKIFDLLDFGKGRGVVHFGDVHVFGAEGRLLIGFERGAPSDMAREIAGSRSTPLPSAGVNLDRALAVETVERVAAAQDERAAPSLIGAHMARVNGQEISAIVEHRLDRHVV